MVSESVSWPVSMMTGALNPFLRRMRTASRPSTSGRPTSMMTRSIWPAFAACTPLAPRLGGDGFEFLMQGELLREGLAQLGIVINDQDFADIGHKMKNPCRGPILPVDGELGQARPREATYKGVIGPRVPQPAQR